MNTYIIESSDYVVINAKIDDILKKNHLTSDMIIKYDLIETPISTAIEDLDTYNFLSSNKVVVCDNAYFLTSNRPKGTVVHNEELLEKYLKNPSSENILIMICDKIDTRKKLVKLVDKNNILGGEIVIDDLIKKHLDDYKMDYKTIKYLIDYCDNDNERILNELEKLKCYKLGDKTITMEDINNIVIKLTGDNIFSLIDSIVLKNRSKAYLITQELLDKGEDINKIIVMVSDQFRLMYQVKLLLKEGYNKDTIATKLKVHPYRVKLAMEKGYNYSSKVLLTNLDYFFNLDYMIKTGNNNPKLVFELFLANL